MFNIEHLQHQMQQEQIGGWLCYDFRRSNPLAYSFLGLNPIKSPTRRFFYWIPVWGHPMKIVSPVEAHLLDSLPGEIKPYFGWKHLNEILSTLLPKDQPVAMEYSPHSVLPSLSYVDGGTLDLIRSLGVEVVSSGDILQAATSVWSKEQLNTHLYAAKTLEEVVKETWAWICDSVKKDKLIDEYAVQQEMLRRIELKGCYTEDPPTCAVNENSADPHYSPPSKGSKLIQKGDWILLDLWCKQKSPNSVYADITRVGVTADQPSSLQEDVFYVVRQAQKAAFEFIESGHTSEIRIEGWEVDQVCREVIEKAGFGEHLLHRTGHNLGLQVHGLGANLDNWETHDTRPLLNRTGFTIEPGIYLPGQFGVRLEHDVYLHNAEVIITGGTQDKWMAL